MVKVVGLTEREKAERRGLEDLAGIAHELFPDARIGRGARFSFGIFLGDKGLIYVSPAEFQLRVEKPECFDDAVKLAKAYEERYSTEFTVKKEYE